MSGIFKLFGLANRVDETTKRRLEDELKGLYEEQNNQVKKLSDLSKKIDEVKEKINNLPKVETKDESQSETTEPPSPPEAQQETPREEAPKEEEAKEESAETKEGENNFLGFSFKNPFADKEPGKSEESNDTKPVEEPPVQAPVQPQGFAPPPPPPAQLPAQPMVQPQGFVQPQGLQSPPANNPNQMAVQPGVASFGDNSNQEFGEDSELGGGKKSKNKKQKKTKSKTQSGGKKRRTRRNKKHQEVTSYSSIASVEDV
jgi:hypothetical protein